jgi:hypothetical protein
VSPGFWPCAVQAEVTRPPDWSAVDVPGAGTPCYPPSGKHSCKRIFAAFQFCLCAD